MAAVAGYASPPQLVEENPILKQEAWAKMHRENNNWMAAVVGETGLGKSWSAIRIAEAVDPEFTIDQVAFGVVDFLELVNDDSLGRGSVIVFEEASVEASAQEWWSKSNRILAQVLDTWRHQNRGAIFTLPNFGDLQKRARGRMSALIQMRSKNEDAGYTLATYKYCQQDSDTGKIYKKYPRIQGKEFRYLKLRKPSDGLREAYEQRKSEYTNELNKELLNELLESIDDGQDEDEWDNPKDIAEDIIDRDAIDGYLGDNHGRAYVDRSLIEVDYDVGSTISKKVKALLKREIDMEVI